MLQKQGAKSEVYLNQDLLKKQLKHASTKGIHSVIIIDEEEVQQEQIAIKNMKNSDEIKVNKENG